MSSICYEFEPVPTSILERIENPRAVKLLMAISWCLRRGIVCPAVRYLAAMIKVSREWTHKLLKMLEAAGVIRRRRRRISATRNDTNIYEIIGFYPRPLCEVEFTEENVDGTAKTKAPAPPVPPPVDTTVRFLKNENTNLKNQVEFFKRYIAKGIQIARGKQWREKRDARAEHLATITNVGVYDPAIHGPVET